MNAAPPLPTKAVLSTPLNVEESRAQRQQRSQARFRDRGGIFVPSSRNTLADILLGKAPPLTRPRPRRSVSASPLGHLQKGTPGTRLHRISSPTKQKTPTSARRGPRSPQTQRRRSGVGAAAEDVRAEPPAKPSNAAASAVKGKAKSVSKPSARTPKQKSAKNTKSTKQLAADEAESEAENHPARPRPKPKPRKKPEKTKPLPEPSERDEHGTDDIVPASSKANSKAKGKATPKSKPSKATTSKHPVDDSVVISKSKSKPSKPPAQPVQITAPTPPTQTISLSTISKAPASRAPRRPSNQSDLYSGASEDEYVPPVSKAKARPRKAPSGSSKAAAKVPARAPPQAGPSRLADIMEEDEEEEEDIPPRRPEPIKPRVSAAQARVPALQPRKQPISTSSKGKKRPVQDDDDEPLSPPAKRARAAADKDAADKPARVSGAQLKTSAAQPRKQLTSISAKGKGRPGYDEEEEEAPEPHTKRAKAADKDDGDKPAAKSIKHPKAPAAQSRKQPGLSSAKGKGRRVPDDEEDEEPLAKRAKARMDKNAVDKQTAKHRDHASEEENVPVKPSAKARAKLKDAAPEKVATGKKRTRECEEESLPEEREVKPSKRKKVVPVSEKESTPDLPARKPQGKTSSKASSKAKKPPSKVKAAQATRQKENVSTTIQPAIAPRRGPPKSVLQRLKARDAQPEVVDNDPDPIDFLS